MNTEQERPICSVKGMPLPGRICGHVIVGMKHCGYPGDDCPHKRKPEDDKKEQT